MLRWNSIGDVPADFGPSAVTIGNFDGVHLGHQEIVRRVTQCARRLSGKAVAITFDPHPLRVHRPDLPFHEVMGLDDKLELLAEAGVDAVLVQPYSLEFARTLPEDFIRDYVARPFHARCIVVGEDVRFGRENSGSLESLRELGTRYGFAVETVHDLGRLDPLKQRWSSTWVRESVLAGDVAGAAEILGRWHRVRGVVVHGDERGRTLGFPTANLGDCQGLVPKDGIYAGWLTVTGWGDEGASGERALPSATSTRLPAAISIGTNPTFEGEERRVEAYVLDGEGLDLYGRRVLLEFAARVRGTEKFASVGELITAMRADVARVRTLLGADAAGKTA